MAYLHLHESRSRRQYRQNVLSFRGRRPGKSAASPSSSRQFAEWACHFSHKHGSCAAYKPPLTGRSTSTFSAAKTRNKLATRTLATLATRTLVSLLTTVLNSLPDFFTVSDDRVLDQRYQDQGRGRNHGALFIPMLLVPLFVILYPDAILWLPRHLMLGIVK